MAGISFDGVSSGLDTTSIIESLIVQDSKQKFALETKQEDNLAEIAVWKQVSASLISLQLNSYELSRAALFDTMSITSSDEDSITAEVSGTALDGAYTLDVKKLAQSHQMLSNGYDDSDTTYVGSGTLTFEFGKGNIDPNTKLDFINAQDGFDWGSIKIKDTTGNTATIDLSDVIDVKAVVDKINKSDTNIVAEINADGNGINLSNVDTVTEVSGGSTAASLGILKTAVAGSIEGDNIFYTDSGTKLSLINDGLGVRTETGSDFSITVSGFSAFEVDLDAANTLADVESLIETAASDAGVTIDVSVNSNGNGLDIFSSSGNITDITVLNSSNALADLGVNELSGGVSSTVNGESFIGGIDTVMLKNLNGGSGIDLTNDIVINLADTTTVTVTAAELADAVTLDDVMDLISANSAGKLEVTKNLSGNGLQLSDMTSGAAVFEVVSNDTTSDLGLDVSSVDGVINGTNLNVKYISENTLLETLNSGQGVDEGSIRITNSNGMEKTVDLSGSSINDIGDVLDELNTELSSLSITARVNDTGDGIILEDGAGGSSDLKVEDMSGSTAKDLNILGSGTGSIDGAMEFVVDISATDTLEDVRDKINDAGIDVKASVINDGSLSGSYKLMLTSSNTGESGQIIVDESLSGGLGLSFSTIASAQNSVIALGSSGVDSSASIMYKSTNTITDVLQGVTLNLTGISDNPVSLTLSNDYSAISGAVSSYVETFNSLIDLIDEKTAYDAETGVAGELQGDYTINQIKNDLYEIMAASVDGLPSEMNNIAQVGITFDITGRLSFDESVLNEALQDDLDAVEKLFNYSVNIASSTNNTTITGSATDVGYSLTGAIDGNTKYGSFIEESTGYQTSISDAWIQFDFDDKYTLQKFVLYSMDASSMPADEYTLKSFDVEYWDSSENDWVNARSYSNNSSGKVISYFSDAITTDKVRVTNMNGTDDTVRLTEFEVYEARGIASRINELSQKVTDLADGSVQLAIDNLYDNNEILDDQIETWEERLARKEDYYRAQFIELEALMAEFQTTSSWLSTQLGSLDSGWSLRDG